MTNCSEKAKAMQLEYARALSRRSAVGLVAPEAFVRGIRHIGYKSNVEAIAELIDNSIQAYAQRVDLLLGYDDERHASRPTQLAVIDDGHGMSAQMLRFAMMWGGTHRENDRSGLGRFGYGLPCATVSMGRRFTIYSKVMRGKVHAISLDLDLLDAGAYLDDAHRISIPAAQSATLPTFVSDVIAREYPKGWRSGTVVVIDKLDRLDWATAAGLKRNLARQLGVAYHKLLIGTAIYIDDQALEPIDPLFLSPSGKFHSLDEDRARELEPMKFTIQTEAGTVGEVVLRYAWLPPTFGAIDKARDAIGMNANARFPILKQYHGIVFSRNGRVIDVQSRTPWTTFINNDRYIRVEVEFSASLDEAFGVTTSKQQVAVSPEMWERLQCAGLPKAIEHLRAKVRSAKHERWNTDSAPGATSSVRQAGKRQARCMHLETSGPTCQGPSDAPFGPVDPAIALDALLSRIARRKMAPDAKIRVEYERLMRGWTRHLLRISDRRGAITAEYL